MDWYTGFPGLVFLLVSGYFAIRAFRYLFTMLKDSPARYRQLSHEEGFYFLFIHPTRNREFMKCVFLGLICFIAGLALLTVSLPKANP